MVSTFWLPSLSGHVSYKSQIEGTAVYDVLEKGLDDLMALCDAVVTKFTDARDDFATRLQS